MDEADGDPATGRGSIPNKPSMIDRSVAVLVARARHDRGQPSAHRSGRIGRHQRRRPGRLLSGAVDGLVQPLLQSGPSRLADSRRQRLHAGSVRGNRAVGQMGGRRHQRLQLGSGLVGVVDHDGGKLAVGRCRSLGDNRPTAR